MVVEYKKLLYNTVLSQTISSDGKYIFLGNNFGDIFVQSAESFQITEQNNITPEILLFSVCCSQPINSLAFHNDFLIVGTIGKIVGYKWKFHFDETPNLTKPFWTIEIPIIPESIEAADINSMYIDQESNILYAGCGDNNIYQISLEDGKIIRNFKGHKDYIHCVTGQEQQIYSASEDGKILFWNSGEINPIGKLEPYKNDELVRSDYGKWQGTVSISNDWLVCGGGPKASMWHLRTMECTKIFPFPGKAHFSSFLDDLVLIAGEHSSVHHYTFNGETVVDMPTDYPAVYSIVWQRKPYKFMSVAGAGNRVQIMTDFRYMDSFIELYKN